MILNRLFISISLLLFFSVACESSDDDDENTGITAGTLQLNIKSIHTDNASSGLVQDSSAPFKNYSIASGKPDVFNLEIVRITLGPSADSTDQQARPIFTDDEGKTLAITKSRIDLSDMFTNFACVDNNGLVFDLEAWFTDVFPTIDNTNDAGEPNEYRQWTSVNDASCECGFDADNYPLGPNASGNCPPMESDDAQSGKVATLDVDTGTYDTVTVYYKRRAQVKGCITGYFFETWTGSNSVVEASTFCTQTDLGFYDKTGGGNYTAFEDATPQLTDIDLAGPNATTENEFPGSASDLDASEIVHIEFPIPGGIEIGTAESAQLTLMIDTNRILRFFSSYHSGITNSGTPRGPGPDTVADTSYFFTTVFEDSQFFFVGRPGNIYGFELITLPCSNRTQADISGFTQPSDYLCTSSDEEELSAWMTVIEDPDGNIFSANIIPDDDLAYVALKGDNLTYTTEGGGVSYSWGENWESNTDGTFDLNYRLGSIEGGSYQASLDGWLFNIDRTATIGTSIPNVYFVGENSGGVVHGTVEMKRQL